MASIRNNYLEAGRCAVGITVRPESKQVTYIGMLITAETFTFRYRSLFLGTEELKRQLFFLASIEYDILGRAKCVFRGLGGHFSASPIQEGHPLATWSLWDRHIAFFIG